MNNTPAILSDFSLKINHNLFEVQLFYRFITNDSLGSCAKANRVIQDTVKINYTLVTTCIVSNGLIIHGHK
ncbi:hypothetical protein DGG96_19335 [Legionella qingyii]|uniref:Uncharacterized protein n=1 Tax=Legionella qingyii TaxID=2184757 RepID=A0A317TZW9_9GAMM|nr:hypothetical protein [Legionella qingyii]PWY53996.1 hypothetical protein DGG96_19335 [Legionella qingyii]